MNDTITEFKLRTYGRMELAQMYSPHIQPVSAYRKLQRWIDRVPNLRQHIQQAGATRASRTWSPSVVSLIVDALGEP